MTTDPTREPAYKLVAIDASDGDWYALGRDAADQVAVWTKGSGGLPAAERAARLDPSSWRLHDMLALTPDGNDDLRLAVQVFNDWEGPWANPEEGHAPAQAEHFHPGNRSTREVDASGRTALPGSMRRIVGSEDARYALALAVAHLPMDPIAHEQDGKGEEGTRTAADRAKDKARDRHLVPPGVNFLAAADIPGGLAGPLTAAGAAAGRRQRPLGYLTDEWGGAGQLGAVMSASLGPGLYNGRDGQPLRLAVLRADAHFATAGPNVAGAASPGLTGPILFDARDASAIPDNEAGFEIGLALEEAAGDSFISSTRPRPVKGRMWHDRSWAGSGLSPNELGQTGKWVPVLFVTSEDVNLTKKKPPKKPPPFPPPPEEEDEDDDDDDEEDEPEEPTTGAGVDPRFIEGFIPVPGTDLSEGGIGFVGSGGPEGKGTGTISSDGEVVENGPQARDYEGQGVPCPATGVGVVNSDGETLTDADLTDRLGKIISEGLGELSAGWPEPQNADGQAQVADRVYSTHPGGNPDQQPRVGAGGQGFLRSFRDQVTRKRTMATARMPGPGQPGSPSTLQGYLDSMSARLSAHADIIAGAFGGPSFLASNIAVQHVNTPGNPPATSRVGARWSAPKGTHLALELPAFETVQVLDGTKGTITAKGPGVHRIARELRGSVIDKRPLLELDNGDRRGLVASGPRRTYPRSRGDLISSRTGKFKVDADEQLSTSQASVLIDQRYGQPMLAVQVGYFNPLTGAMLGQPTWGVTPDGVSLLNDLSAVPDNPPSGMLAIYSRGGQAYMLTSSGTETALGVGGGGLVVQEEDGAPTGAPTTLKVPNGTLVDNGDGSFSFTGGGAGLSNPVTIGQGGTGQTTAANARTALGLAIGTNVQAWDAQLDDFASLAPTKGRILVGNGTNWTAIAVGTDGQVVTADSAEATGIKWATAGAGGLGDPVTIAHGGTNATTEAGARTNLGLAIGTNVQAWHQNLTDLAGLTFAADRAIYINNAGALVVGTISAMLDDLTNVSTNDRFLVRTGGTWQAANATADSILGTNAAGSANQFAASANQAILAKNAAGTLGFTGALNVTSTNGVNSGFAQIESTGNATSGSFQLNVDMVTTSSAIAGAESALALQIDNATQNKFKIRADGTGGFDIFLRNISGTTSNHYYDASANVWEFGAALRLINQAAPSTPAAGATVLYAKTGALVTWKGSAGTENTGVTPQTAPSSASTYGSSMTSGSGWADSTAQTQFNDAVSRFNDFVTNGHNAQAINGGANAHRTAQLAAGTYV